MKTLFRAIFTITIFSVITRCLGFLFHIYISREMGAEMVGIYQVGSSFVGIIMTLVCSGIPLTTAKMCSAYDSRGQANHKARVVGSSLIIALAISAVVVSLAYSFQDVLGGLFADKRSIEVMLVLLPSVIFSAVYAVFRGAMWGENRYFAVSITELVEQVVRVGLTIVLFTSAMSGMEKVLNAGQALTIACVVSAVLAVVIFFSSRGRVSFGKGDFKNILRSSSSITGIRIVGSMVQPVAALIIPAQLMLVGFSASASMSMYGVMMGMTSSLLYIPMALIGSIGMALIPNLSASLANKDYSNISNTLGKSFSITMFVAFLFVPVYLGIGDSIGIILFDNALSGILLQNGAMAVISIALCGLSNSVLNGMNLETKSFKNYIFGAIVMLAIFWITTRWININSVIAAITVGMAFMAYLNVRMLYKTVPKLNLGLIPKLIRYMCIALPCALLGKFVNNIMLNYCHIIVAGIISGLVIVASYVLLCKTFNIVDFSHFGKMKKKNKHRAISKQKLATN